MEPKILRLLDPQGEPDIIECDGKRYVPERTCKYEFVPNIGNGMLNAVGLRCSICGREQMSLQPPNYCGDCGAKVVYE